MPASTGPRVPAAPGGRFASVTAGRCAPMSDTSDSAGTGRPHDAGTIKQTGELVSDDTAASAEQAAQNAGIDMSSYPRTSGDVDTSDSSGDPELDAAMATVDDVRTYLTDESVPEERRRRADAVEAAEDARPGDNRKGVMDAVAQAREA